MIKFTKMHGIGNDYIYFDCTEHELSEPEKLAVKLSDRHKGVGGDGIILILKSDVADFRMRMFNADGSEGKMCGNGTRCIAKYVFDRGLTNKKEFTLETLAGIKKIKVFTENGKVKTVSVDMGAPVLDAKDVPVISDVSPVINAPFETENGVFNVTAVSMGNPHGVIFTKTPVKEIDVEKLGRPLENHPSFPDRANIEFINVLSKTELDMRVWERGSGETLACGTGACAAVVAACENGFCDKTTEVCVHLLGGDLYITYSDTVVMRGPAEFVFDGELTEE